MDILDHQKSIVDFLSNSKKQDRLAHAYLFEGPKGVGKLEVALYFVCMLWCKKSKPCLKCDTCQSILNKNFMNLIYISSDTQLIKTADISDLQKEFASTAPLDGPRFYIIDGAEKMSNDTQNKLLKFIEEPVSSQTFGILLTTNADLIIPTIKSRVISLSFKELSYEYLVQKLSDSKVATKYVKLLPFIEKDVDKCIALLETDVVRVIDKLYEFINKLTENDYVLFFKENQDLFSNRVNLVLFINLLEEFYKDVYKSKVNIEPSCFNNIDMSVISSRYKISYISEIVTKLVELETKLRYNGNINLNIVKLLIILNGGVI